MAQSHNSAQTRSLAGLRKAQAQAQAQVQAQRRRRRKRRRNCGARTHTRMRSFTHRNPPHDQRALGPRAASRTRCSQAAIRIGGRLRGWWIGGWARRGNQHVAKTTTLTHKPWSRYLVSMLVKRTSRWLAYFWAIVSTCVCRAHNQGQRTGAETGVRQYQYLRTNERWLVVQSTRLPRLSMPTVDCPALTCSSVRTMLQSA